MRSSYLTSCRPFAHRLRRQPLAICLAAILGVPAMMAAHGMPSGSTLLVTNCDDDGPGSLRAVIAGAVSGDTIGFSSPLACSQITLSGGAIVIGQGGDGQPIVNLELIGPGRNALTIDGNYLDRVLVHDAGDAGLLTISGLAMKHGRTSGDGGCLLAHGSVSLTDVEISECGAVDISTGNAAMHGGGLFVGGNASLDTSFVGDNEAHAQGGYAYGAGLFAAGDVTLTATTISGNYAHSEAGAAYGGGVVAGDFLGHAQATISVAGSSIENNTAFSNCGACPVRGAGAWIYGNSTFADSLITGNTAFSSAHYGAGGGLYFRSRYNAAPVSATLTNTNVGSNSADLSAGGIGAGGDLTFIRGTISGNSAGTDGGAIGLFGGNLNLIDSTLTGNIASDRGGGIFIFGYGDVATSNSTISENLAGSNGGAIANTYGTAHLANTTVAFNTATGNGGGIYFRYAYYTLDLQSTVIASNQASGNAEDIWSPGTSVSGANNLVMAAPSVDLPGDTLSDDPLLQELADNGGPTLTHALGEGSPAIDAGNNAAALDFDQRGDGFIRVYGTAPDIGAFETQPTEPVDRIFADGFDP